MADFLSRLMDDNSQVYEDTQNSLMPLNRDVQDDFVLSCMDSQSENSQTFEFMKMHNSDRKETNLEVIREEDSSFFTNMQLDYEEPQGKKLNKDSLNHSLNPGNALKSMLNQHENSKENFGNNKGHSHGSVLTEKMLKISQEIDDIYEETQRSESSKAKDLGLKDLSSAFTMNKVNVHPPSTITTGGLNYQTSNQSNTNNQHVGQGFQNNNNQTNYGNFNQANSSSNPSMSTNFQTGKAYTVTNLTAHSSFIPANNLTNMNSSNNNYSGNYGQNAKLNMLNSLNPNSNVPTSTSNLKTKTKTNINYAPSVTVSNNGTPAGFYNEGMSASTSNNNNFMNQNKTSTFPTNNINVKNTASPNYELSNSFRAETDDHIKKTLVVFDHIKLNFCNFIDNYKNKFIHDADLIKQVLLGETEYITQEEDKNRLIDSRMETLFRDMMNILNEFQRY